MNAYEWIERAKKELDATDYAIAKRLEIPTSQMTSYKNGRAKTLSDETALKLAELLKINPLEILADQAAERSKKNEVKSFWKKLAAANLSLGLAMFGGIFVAILASSGSGVQAVSILCQIGAWLLAAVVCLIALSRASDITLPSCVVQSD